MFVDILNSSMLLSRGVFRGAIGAHPPPGSVKYMHWGVGGLPPIFKTMSSSQPFLNLSNYKSEDQEIYFKDLYLSVSQIVHSLFYILCMQALFCCLKLFIFQ